MSTIYTPLTWSILACQGKQAQHFLQGMATTDLTLCTTERVVPGFLCQYQGKVYASGFFYQPDPSTLWFLSDHSQVESAQANLLQYARLSRVTLSTIALDAVGIILTDPCTTSTTYQLKKVKHKLSVTLSPYCQLHFSKPDLQSTCSSKHTDITNPETNHLWRTALLKANIPLFSTSTLQQFTPNQLGLVPSAWVSLSKGCYCGQEIIARCYHLGQAKRTLHTLFSTQSCYLAPGTRLRDLQKNITLTVLAAISSEQGTWLQLVGPTYFQCKPQAILHTPCGTALPTVTC